MIGQRSGIDPRGWMTLRVVHSKWGICSKKRRKFLDAQGRKLEGMYQNHAEGAEKLTRELEAISKGSGSTQAVG